MNKQKLNIWGRDFELDVVYEKYSGEEILQTQKTALQQFISAPNIIEASKTAVEQYCLKWNKDEIGTDKIDNLFKLYLIKEFKRLKYNKHIKIKLNGQLEEVYQKQTIEFILTV